jgi:tetratricopeptide (TPR) repeat protein
VARKELLVDLLTQGHFEEKSFYDGLSEAERNQSGKVDDWSPKDVLAHCSYWKQVRVADIQRVMEGGTVTRIDDFDHENARIFEQFSDQSWQEVMAYAEEATGALAGQLEKMSEAELELEWQDERPIWQVVVGNGYSHPLSHISEHYQQKGDIQRAAELTGMLGKPLVALDDGPTWIGTAHYNAACSYSLLGNRDKAIKELGEALALRPNLIEWSKQDPDLEAIREEAGYKALYSD